MNGKKAKKLRRLSRLLSGGFVPTDYVAKRQPTANMLDRKFEVNLDPACTRAMYKTLKQAA